MPHLINLCPLTQSTCFTNMVCNASEFVDSKLAENGHLTYSCDIDIKQAPVKSIAGRVNCYVYYIMHK